MADVLRGRSAPNAPDGPFEPPVMPHQYEAMFELAAYGKLTAGEFAGARRWAGGGRAMGNRLRLLVRFELVERDADGFYDLTPAGREWIAAPRLVRYRS